MAANEPYSLKYTGQEIDDLLDVVNDLGPASTTTPGLMSASDKIKLDDIEPEAEENVIDEVQLGGTALSVQDKTVNIPLDSAPASGSNNPVKSGGVYNALAGINEKIPSEASASNKLADKDYVDESVSTSSATYISNNGQPFASLADLQAYTGAHDKNDYAYVVGTDAAGNTVYNRYKFDGTNWAFEYAINNTAFTTSQWNTINSGMVAADKTKLDALPNNETLQEDLDEKAKKVSGATAGNFAALDGNGNLVDSGKKEADFYADGQVVPFAEGLADTVSAGTAQEFTYRKSGGDGVNWMRRIKGKSLVWNQLVRNGNFADTSAWSSITVENNVGTLTPSVADGNCQLRQFITKSKDHKYYIRASLKFSNLSHLAIDNENCLRHIWYGTSNVITTLPLPSADDTWRDYSFVMTGNANYTNAEFNFIVLYKSGGAQEGDTMSAKNVYCIDLTLLFGAGKEPSTVAEFEALYNELYYPYQPGVIKNNDAVAIETVGFNQWDEEIAEGAIDQTTGEDIPGGALRSVNKIHVFPGANYFLHVGSLTGTGIRLFYYDANQAYIGTETPAIAAIKTIPSGVYFIRFHVATSVYGTTYNHDICINLSDASRNGTYEPYWKKSIQLGLNAFRVTDGTNIITVNGLKSAGSVYDEIDPVRKKYIKRLGEVDLGTLNWTLNETYGFIATPSPTPKISFSAICDKYPFMRAYSNVVDKTCGYIFNTGILVKDTAYSDAATFKTAMDGAPLYYELATPVEYDLVDDIPNAIEVDENGTERAIFPEAVDPSAPFCSDSNYSVSIRKLTAFINSQNS